MPDFNIPSVTDKFKTNDLIKNLMELERVPLKREQGRLDTYKAEQTAWRTLNAQMNTLRETVRSLYSYDNAFASKIASSTDEYAITADPGRDANLESFKIEVLQKASADRFLSAELDAKTEVPAGNYEYSVKDKTLKFNWKGGKLSDFVAALNRRSSNTIRASIIGINKNTQSLLIESLIPGAENRLTFSGAAKDFALQTGMIQKKPAVSTVDFSINRSLIKNTASLSAQGISITETEVSLPPRSGFEAALPQALLDDGENQIEFSAYVQTLPLDEILATEPRLPSSGIIHFKDISLENENLDTQLPKIDSPPPPPLVEDNNAVFIKTADGKELPLLPLNANGTKQSFAIKVSDYADIRSIIIKNNNTHKKLIMSPFKVTNLAASSDFEPSQPIEIAADAKIKYQGITISRSSNKIDDVVPNVSLNIHEKTEKPATIAISPDVKAAKESLITFVGKYNRLVAELNILTQTKPEIVSELEYFNEDEAKKANERLGMFQTEFALTNTKSSLQRIVTNRYPAAEDSTINLLAQIGISSNASSGFTGLAPSRLRGYLEIDEKKLDASLKDNMPDIKNLFGSDTDGDLVIDSGIAYQMDKNIQSFTQIGGIIATKTSSLDAKINSSKKNIDSLETKLAKKEKELKVKYGQMESALNSLESQAESINNFSKNQNNSR